MNEEGYITMSNKEIDRLATIQRICNKQIKQKDAATVLGLTTRQVRRLVRGYQKQGANALVSKHRGKTSNRKYPEVFKKDIVEHIRCQYYDFGPTLATEKLAQRQNINIGIETARNWMTEAGIWKPKVSKKAVVHPPRARRHCYGDLVQIDGSPHAWFEARGPSCTLIVFIDDATSKILMLRFFNAETTFAYFEMVKLYLAKYGKPVSFYSDKLSVFKVNQKEAVSGTGETQFKRAMRELDINLVFADSPQAKGRVERCNKTLQDRLVKELRLQNISTMEEGNKFLETYMLAHNNQFAIPAFEPTDLHRPIDLTCNLDIILTHQETREVQKNITIRYKNSIYQIEIPGKGYRLRQGTVTVCESASGEITLLHKGQSLSYKVYDKNQYYSEPVSSKELNAPLRLVHDYKPGPNHPWKREATMSYRLRQLRAQGLIARQKKVVMLPPLSASIAGSFGEDYRPR